ncbi:MAG: hypothetical protein M1829_000881 [Trizodia sp. TS-e1964]|nr:MAG: hypothetical protein M1829_000881 [Trizodia sp. TS-e1964]
MASTFTDGPPPSENPPFQAADYANDGKFHLLLCATGSVATIKLPTIARALSHYPHLSIRILLSESASRFLVGQSTEQPEFQSLVEISNVDGMHPDAEEWRVPWQRGHAILHIELRRWADLMIIAPLSANSLAKLAAGLSDSLIMSVARSWDTTGTLPDARGDKRRKILAVAPAMNTGMWLQPVTATHLHILEEEWGGEKGWIRVLRPVAKELACGDIGVGAMVDWKVIVEFVETQMGIHAANSAM